MCFTFLSPFPPKEKNTRDETSNPKKTRLPNSLAAVFQDLCLGLSLWWGALASACDPYFRSSKNKSTCWKQEQKQQTLDFRKASCLFDSGTLPETNSKSTCIQTKIPKGKEPSSNPSIFRGENVSFREGTYFWELNMVCFPKKPWLGKMTCFFQLGGICYVFWMGTAVLGCFPQGTTGILSSLNNITAGQPTPLRYPPRNKALLRAC